jgi:UDP:flavonoid glycosyltransferase YjiC (YdhE family)
MRRDAPATLDIHLNVLLFALGSHGDVHPFVGIGLRLKERGHHVAVAANDYFKPLVDHAQLEFISIGTAEEYRSLATNPDLWNPFKGPQAVFQGTARYLRPMYDIAADFARRPDAVIAASTLALGARIAQDKLGVPLASVHLSPAIFQSADAPPQFLPFSAIPSWTPRPIKSLLWRGINKFMDSMIGPPLNALRAELGLPPVKAIIRDYWHSPQLAIGLFPSWFAPPQRDWPTQVRLTGFPLYDEPDLSPMSAELIDFIEAGEPPIAFTPGSAMWKADDFFRASADACARIGRRGLLLTRHRDHIPAQLPDGVIHVHYAPFSQLLPRCAAFVHHGGIGSSAQALAAGVRQVVAPFAHDQPDNADRLRRLGVARVVPPPRYKADRVATVLRELIENPSVAAACQSTRQRFEGLDAIGQTCDLIESLARSPVTIAV